MGREKTSGSNGQLLKLTKISKAKKPGGGGWEGDCVRNSLSLYLVMAGNVFVGDSHL